MRLFAALAKWFHFSHADMMAMPWQTLLAYADAMAEQIEEQRAAAYIGDEPAMIEEYREHIDEWRRRQPPG